ncbi:MAG: hypothetical protein NT099_00830 [Candidatus Saganbacteria bacterium]|nr:hypothetical protein [Candidatus Saganbacteria bacterium]
MGYGLVATMPFHVQRPWHTDVSSAKALVAFVRERGTPLRIMRQLRVLQCETGMDIAIIKTKPQGYVYPNPEFKPEANFDHVRAILPGGTVVRIAGLDLKLAHQILSSPALQGFPQKIETRTGTKVANVYVNVRRNNIGRVSYDFNSPIDVYLNLYSNVDRDLQELEDDLVGQLEMDKARPWPTPDYLILNIGPREIAKAA